MNKKETKMSMKLRAALHPLNITGKIFVYAYALILIIPLAFAILTAFKTQAEVTLNPIGLPESFNFDNFVTAWEMGDLLNASKNSIIITCTTMVLQMAGIIFATFHLDCIRDTKVGTFLYMLLISSMFIPNVCGVTSLMLRRNLGLYNNLIGEIICGSTLNAFGVFIVSGFVRTLPRELREAAKIDGASDFYYVTRIMCPLVKPALLTVGIFNFTSMWNNALGAMLTLRDRELWTIPMALILNFTEQYSVRHEVMFAGVILTSIPLVIAYCLCQKHFVSALTGSVKG